MLPVMLLISILLGLIPLAGIAWIIVSGTKVRNQEKTWPVLHPLQKMVINRNLLRKILRRSPPRPRTTKCPRGIERSFS